MYHVTRLRDRWDGDLTLEEIEIERKYVSVFDKSRWNLIMKLPKYIWENYWGGERISIEKEGDDIVSSYTFLLVVHNTSALYSWVVLNSLVTEMTDMKIIKTARGKISISFRC